MQVIITVDANDTRHKELEQRVWDKFPNIGGIVRDAISTRQYTLNFSLEQENPETMREFLQKEDASFTFKAL